MQSWEGYALKFVALALNEAIENAENKRVYRDGRVAIPFRELRFDKSFKSAILRIARRYGLVKYSTADFGKNTRVIVVDVKKLKHVIYDNLGEIESNLGGFDGCRATSSEANAKAKPRKEVSRRKEVIPCE